MISVSWVPSCVGSELGLGVRPELKLGLGVEPELRLGLEPELRWGLGLGLGVRWGCGRMCRCDGGEWELEGERKPGAVCKSVN